MAGYSITVVLVIVLVCLVGTVTAENGCIIVQKQVIDHGYPTGPVSFTVDLKDAGGAVINSLTFTATGMKAFTDVPPGDYTIVERDPGSVWKVTNNNIPVHVVSGQACSPANTVTIANEYYGGCVVVQKIVFDNGYTGPMSFVVDLKNSAGTVVDTRTFTGSGLEAFRVTPGDYTIAERDPGPIWKVTNGNVRVRVVAGQTCSPENTVIIGNEYDGGCIIVQKEISGYSGPVNFAIDLKNSAGTVADTLTFTGPGVKTFNGVPGGDYTVSERDPGTDWVMEGDYNKQVHVVFGIPPDGCNRLTISNRYVSPACVEDMKAGGGGCDEAVHLSWTRTGADHYVIYRGTTAGGPYAMIGSVTTGSFEDSTAGAGTTWYYVVRPADASGTEFCQSNEVLASVSQCAPEFPAVSLSAVFAIGFAGAVFLIRKRRED